jgi:signal transduction histidine kinase
MSNPLDLLSPDAIARLRHSLRTPLNHIVGYAEVVYRQAKDQGASAEMKLMEEVAASARKIGDMVSEALPANSHVGEGSISRLQDAMRGYVERIAHALDRFQQLSRGACETEIGKIRNATRQLLDFARSSAPTGNDGA